MVESDLIIVTGLMVLFAMVIAISDLARLIIARRDRRDYPFFAYSGEVIIYDRKHLDELDEVLP
jgi:hypothetical protein